MRWAIMATSGPAEPWWTGSDFVSDPSRAKAYDHFPTEDELGEAIGATFYFVSDLEAVPYPEVEHPERQPCR